MIFLDRQWPRHAFQFKGASAPAVTAPAAAPASATTLEVTQAKIDAARQAKARKGIQSTVVAGQQPLGGAANGANSLAPATQQKSSLLGGG